jgi:SAM-dependent methyltransferase
MSQQADEVRAQVRDRYAAAALAVTTTGSTTCCGVSAEGTVQEVEVGEGFGAQLYAGSDRDALPAEAVAASLGCGNPLAVADLREGETVLDLGSGGGIDVLLSAGRVGPTGRAYGVDMTDEMLALARANAARAGATNVEFVKGTIEAVPLPDASVDVVISNCVINLSGDKPQVLREAARVLKPGGRLLLLDHVRSPIMPVRLVERLLDRPLRRFSGCNLMRDPLDYLCAVGFVVDRCDRFRWGIVVEVVARKG